MPGDRLEQPQRLRAVTKLGDYPSVRVVYQEERHVETVPVAAETYSRGRALGLLPSGEAGCDSR